MRLFGDLILLAIATSFAWAPAVVIGLLLGPVWGLTYVLMILGGLLVIGRLLNLETK